MISANNLIFQKLLTARMEFSNADLELETISVEPSDICLSSSAETCQVCRTGTVVTVGKHTNLIIYTRDGTFTKK